VRAGPPAPKAVTFADSFARVPLAVDQPVALSVGSRFIRDPPAKPSPGPLQGLFRSLPFQ